MKLLFLLVIALIIAGVVYVFSSFLAKRNTKKGRKLTWKKPIVISTIVFILLVGLIFFGAYSTANQPDTQCSVKHPIVSSPPFVPSANGYFKLGDFYYEQGNCQQAVNAYTKAIKLNPNFAQAYNNRAYTNMRLRNYKEALPDLNKAIELNPNYVQALMNRGDIHNYYYQIDRQAAIADYKRVIAITGPSGSNTSVCGHLFLAKHNGWTLGAFFDFFTGAFRNCSV